MGQTRSTAAPDSSRSGTCEPSHAATINARAPSKPHRTACVLEQPINGCMRRASEDMLLRLEAKVNIGHRVARAQDARRASLRKGKAKQVLEGHNQV
eukprot:387228-Rhodomonas_salina.4